MGSRVGVIPGTRLQTPSESGVGGAGLIATGPWSVDGANSCCAPDGMAASASSACKRIERRNVAFPIDSRIPSRTQSTTPGAGKRDRRQSPLDRRGGHLPRRNDLKQTIHSLRNAVTGSMRPARLAGK